MIAENCRLYLEEISREEPNQVYTERIEVLNRPFSGLDKHNLVN